MANGGEQDVDAEEVARAADGDDEPAAERDRDRGREGLEVARLDARGEAEQHVAGDQPDRDARRAAAHAISSSREASRAAVAGGAAAAAASATSAEHDAPRRAACPGACRSRRGCTGRGGSGPGREASVVEEVCTAPPEVLDAAAAWATGTAAAGRSRSFAAAGAFVMWSRPLKTKTAFQMLPLVEPIAYGRCPVGTMDTATIHDSATTTNTAPAARQPPQAHRHRAPRASTPTRRRGTRAPARAPRRA